MTFLIGDLVQKDGLLYVVWEILDDKRKITVISLNAEEVRVVETDSVTLITSVTGADAIAPELYLKKNDIVTFKLDAGVAIGMVKCFRDGEYHLEREVPTAFGDTVCVRIEQQGLLQIAPALIQTLFRAQRNAAIRARVKVHRNAAEEARQKAKFLFERAEMLRTEATALTHEYEDEKEKAERWDEDAYRLLGSMI